ncbi:MAG: GGDEF domain-containing protein [Syntrophotaleaceae bacterium]
MNLDRPYNILTLKFFDKELEENFRKDYFNKDLLHHRSALLAGTFLYAIFGILDWFILPEKKEICWLIRYAVVCPVLVSCYFITFTNLYRKFQPYIIFLVAMTASLGLIVMISIASEPGNYLYYAGLFLCVLFYYELIPDHILSNILAWGTFVLYVIAAALFSSTPAYFLFNNSFIFFFFNIAGMFACYNMDQSKRADYLQRQFIEQQAQQLKKALEDVERERARVEKLSLQDPLTALSNRRHFFTIAEKEMKRKARYQHPLAVMLMDLDHFKKINDTFGHAAGDMVLQKVAEIIMRTIRSSDLACRYGGEEFAILLPETDRASARQLGIRLLHNIEQSQFVTERGTVYLSASLGIAALNGEEQVDPLNLIERADQVLYQAKNAGRNQLRFWEAPRQDEPE